MYISLSQALFMGGVLSFTIFSIPTLADDTFDHAQDIEETHSIITLNDAVAKAISASPRIKARAAGISAAKGLREQADYWPNPNVGIEAEDVAGSGQFSGINGAEITYGVSQRIETGGKRASRITVAEHDIALAQIETDIERLNLIRDVHVAYTDAVAAQEILQFSKDRKILAEQVYATVKKRVNTAREPEIQQSKANIGVASATFNMSRAERELQHTKHVLSSLWAGHNGHFKLDDENFYNLQLPPTEQEVELLLDSTPYLRRWDTEYQRRASVIDVEKSQAIPDPTIAVGVRDLRGAGEQAFMVGLSIPIPVFNTNQGNITKARNDALQAKSQGLDAELTLRNEVFQHLEDLTNAYEEAETLKRDIVPSAKKAFRLSREGYQAGKFPYLEVLDAQRTLFEVKEQYVDALKRYHVAKVNVERLTTSLGEES